MTAARGPDVDVSYQIRYDPDRTAGTPADPSQTAVAVGMKIVHPNAPDDGTAVLDQTVEVFSRPAGSGQDWYDDIAWLYGGNGLAEKNFA